MNAVVKLVRVDSSKAVRKAKVFWTDKEKLMLAQEVNSILSDTAPAIRCASLNSRTLNALDQAQKNLVKSGKMEQARVRNIVAITVVEWLPAMVSKCADEMQSYIAKEQERMDEELANKRREDQKQSVVENIGLVPTQALVSELLNRFADIIDLRLLPIAVPLLERLAPTLAPMIENVVTRSMASHFSKFTANPGSVIEVPKETRHKKVPIIVIGLKGTQPETIKKSFGERFDITFFNCDVTSSQLKSSLRFTDHVFYMTGFTSHTIQSILKNSKVKFDYVSGGLTSLRSHLLALDLNTPDKV
jgi:hypothetical protein